MNGNPSRRIPTDPAASACAVERAGADSGWVGFALRSAEVLIAITLVAMACLSRTFYAPVVPGLRCDCQKIGMLDEARDIELLPAPALGIAVLRPRPGRARPFRYAHVHEAGIAQPERAGDDEGGPRTIVLAEIGRASCRERV